MSSPEKEKLYHSLAKYYDLIYRFKENEKESEKLRDLIERKKEVPGRELLDVACGTGGHLQHLRRHYSVTGMDLSREMLALARKKCPGVELVPGDMISFDLKRKFDVVTCLFSSIGYVKTYRNLERTISSFSKHLRQGGLLLIEPFFTVETWSEGTVHALFVDEPEVKIARMNINKRRGEVAIIDFHFLIAAKEGVRHLRDRHEMGLFDRDRFLEIMKKNGFRARFLKHGLMKGRGLYVGVKKARS